MLHHNQKVDLVLPVCSALIAATHSSPLEAGNGPQATSHMQWWVTNQANNNGVLTTQ